MTPMAIFMIFVREYNINYMRTRRRRFFKNTPVHIGVQTWGIWGYRACAANSLLGLCPRNHWLTDDLFIDLSCRCRQSQEEF